MFAAPTIAQAQFGGLINKVKSKVAPQPQNSADAPHFDATTVELTPSQVDAVIRGFSASINVLNGTNGNSVQVLSARVKAAVAEADALEAQHPGQREQYQNSSSKISSCRSEAFDKIHQGQAAQMQSKMMSDPAFRTKYMALAKDMQAAAASRDTSAVRKAQEHMFNTLMPTTRADTLSIDKQCGAMPAPPAFIARENALDAQRDTLDERIRGMQTKAGPAGAQASGLTVPQYATAQERIEYFLGRAKNGVAQRGFTAPELSALQARAAELTKLLAQLNASKG